MQLDTLTSKQYTTPIVYGHDVLTTCTDYVNRHLSLLDDNYPCTMTTSEVYIGVVKAPGLHQNPIQHYEDLCMLEQSEDLKFAFVNAGIWDVFHACNMRAHVACWMHVACMLAGPLYACYRYTTCILPVNNMHSTCILL